MNSAESYIGAVAPPPVLVVAKRLFNAVKANSGARDGLPCLRKKKAPNFESPARPKSRSCALCPRQQRRTADRLVPRGTTIERRTSPSALRGGDAAVFAPTQSFSPSLKKSWRARVACRAGFLPQSSGVVRGGDLARCWGRAKVRHAPRKCRANCSRGPPAWAPRPYGVSFPCPARSRRSGCMVPSRSGASAQMLTLALP